MPASRTSGRSDAFGIAYAVVGETVTATMKLPGLDVAEGTLALVGQAAASHGAMHFSGGAPAIESTCRYFTQQEGDVVKASARALHRTDGLQVWRASVHRGFGAFLPDPANQAAEVTQSFAASSTARTSASPIAESDNAGRTADQRRRQIFRAACEVIGSKGYDKASVREIAAAAGLPVPTLYLYVRNKEDILHMITQGLMEDLFRDFRENLSTEGSAQEKLSRAVASYFAYIDRNRRYINLVYRETRSLSRENREKIFAIERDFARLWQEIIEDGVRAGAFRAGEPALLAEFVYFLCTGWAIRHWTLGRFEAERVRDEIVQFALSGLGATAKGRRRND